jgi:hypothetical protein
MKPAAGYRAPGAFHPKTNRNSKSELQNRNAKSEYDRRVKHAIFKNRNHTHRIRRLNSGDRERPDDYVELHYHADNQFSSSGIGQF